MKDLGPHTYAPQLGLTVAQRMCLEVEDDRLADHMLGLAMAFRVFCRFRFGRRQPLEVAVRCVLRDILSMAPIRRGRLHLSRHLSGSQLLYVDV